MKDEPLLHARKFDDLVLEYLFGDGHRESFPTKNPHRPTAVIMTMNERKSTIAHPFEADYFCFKMVNFVLQVLKFVGSCTAHIPKIVVDINFPQLFDQVIH